MENTPEEAKEPTIAKRALAILSTKEEFLIDKYGSLNGPCCAIGYIIADQCPDTATMIGTINRNSEENCPAAIELRSKSREFLTVKYGEGYADIAEINNNSPYILERYRLPTVKERVLLLLNDMIEAGY